jgi:N-acetylglucosaminyldiphosphoundecaprenol N-acetyl-beta-D-mannosaminyltransferase
MYPDNSSTSKSRAGNMDRDSNTVTLPEPEISADKREVGHVPPIFVVGVWRSGTTLLYSLLNQHPDIRLFYESDLPALWPMFRLPWGRKTWVEKWEYWNAGVSRHDLDSLRLAAPVASLAEALELAGREYAAEKGKTRWGCKSPSYYDRLEDLAQEFPDARFVVIWRDPEEVCLSVIKAATTALWFARPGMAHKALLASKTLKKQVEKLQSRGAFVHQLHFRDLIGDTVNTMSGICEFLQVPFDPAVTILERADRSAVFEGAHHTLAKGSEIIAQKERKDSLPSEMTEKIRRYKALWKAQSGDNWFLSRHFSETGTSKPGILERAADHLKFMLLRAWDIAPRIAFSILPLSAWQAYRRFKYKDEQWVHRQITTKPTTLRSKPEDSQTTTHSPEDACAVRLGKVRLQSMSIDDLLSTSVTELKHIVTVHSEMFVCAHENPAFEEILKHTVNTIDGRIVLWLCSRLYPGQNLRKMSGSDFIYNLADHAAARRERIFLLGSDAEANRGTVEALKLRCPDLTVEGYSPPFCANIQDQTWNEDILGRIANFRPAHLVVCFGPVKQETWISQNANYLFGLGVRCAYGLGGTLDFVSGRKKRAPKWMQMAGAEWLFRVITEPTRLGRTLKMFKMPYFAARFYKREIELLGKPEESTLRSQTQRNAN